MFIIPLFVWLSGKMLREMPEANNELLLHNRFEKHNIKTKITVEGNYYYFSHEVCILIF